MNSPQSPKKFPHVISRAFYALLVASAMAAAAPRENATDTWFTELVDQPGVLTAEETSQLGVLIAEHNRDGLGLIKLLVVQRLPAGLSIEDYARSVLQDELALADRRADRVLVLLAMDNKKMRIEVSASLWSVLPDQFCKTVIEKEMTPQFRRAKYFDGLKAGVTALIGRLTQPNR
jgi:uncharacterized protein